MLCITLKRNVPELTRELFSCFLQSYFITSFLLCFGFVFVLKPCCLRLTVSLSILYSFFLFYFTGWNLSTMLNKSSGCGHPCLVPSHKRDSIQSFTRNYVVFHRCSLSEWRSFQFIPNLLRVLFFIILLLFLTGNSFFWINFIILLLSC